MRVANSVTGTVAPVEVIEPMLVFAQILGFMVQDGIVSGVESEIK